MFKSIIDWVKSAVGNKFINVYFNDPKTPDLRGQSSAILKHDSPAFTVVGWTGNPGRGNPGSVEFQSGQVYNTMVTAINFIQEISGQPILKRWAATHNLVAIPRAGQQLNAYYDRSSLRFFFYKESTGNVVYTCESVDVVSHELGHAILDALRPDLWSTASLEIFALHESFGDIVSVLTVLQFDQVVNRVVQETGGDLRKSNVASRVAEELGGAIYQLSGGKTGGSNYLRNAANELVYVVPESLPANGQGEGLFKEPHNFSRVFTGAWYECLVEVYARLVSSGMSQFDALKEAAKVMALRLFHGVMAAPSTPRFFESVAQSMLKMDHSWGNTYFDIMYKVFIKRKIIQPFTFSVTKLDKMPTIDTRVLDSTVEGNRMRFSMSGEMKHEKIIVELPKYGITNDISGTETVKSVEHCIHYIQEHKLLGNEYELKMFALVDGCLTRNYICNAFRKE